MNQVRAMDIDEGHSFKWNNESYVVIRHEEDNLIVHRTVDSSDRVIADKYRHDENFNPYACVERVLK